MFDLFRNKVVRSCECVHLCSVFGRHLNYYNSRRNLFIKFTRDTKHQALNRGRVFCAVCKIALGTVSRRKRKYKIINKKVNTSSLRQTFAIQTQTHRVFSNESLSVNEKCVGQYWYRPYRRPSMCVRCVILNNHVTHFTFQSREVREQKSNIFFLDRALSASNLKNFSPFRD